MTEPLYNSEIYYERTDINEFLREHPMMGDLYDVTLQCLFAQGATKKDALYVFNQAYYICMLIIEKGGDKQTIAKLIDNRKFHESTFQGLVLAVVKCLLRVHMELVPFDTHIIKYLNAAISSSIDTVLFNHVVNNYAGDFDRVLNFSGKRVEIPVEEKNEYDDPSAMIGKALSLIDSAREKLLVSNESKDARICELEEQLRLEREKNHSLILMLQVHEVPSGHNVPDTNRTNAIYDAINVNTIGDYACGLPNSDHATIISTMLSKLSNRALLERNEMQVVNKVVMDIDSSHQLQPARHIHCEKYVEKYVNNDNKNSQVFNGNIDNSQFGK